MPARGSDDLDLDGNWASSAEPVAPIASIARGTKKKRKLQDIEPDANTPDEPAATATSKRQIKQEKKRQKLAERNESKASVPALAPRAAAASALISAWAAEVKASSLSSLEAKEFVPTAAWFAPCPIEAPLASLPQLAAESAEEGWVPPALSSTSGAFTALHKGKPGTPPARSAGILIVCASTERCFAVVQELATAWKTKPTVLAKYGGGSLKAQIQKQAKVLSKGVSVAVGTPGRLLRLATEGHMDMAVPEAIVLDMARDRKDRGLWKIGEVRKEVFELLSKHIKPQLSKRTRLVLCSGNLTLCTNKTF